MRRLVRLGPLVFRDPLLLCGALYLLLWFDASGFLRIGLCAAILHEMGHIVVYLLLFRRFPVIEVTMTGFCMRTRGQALTRGQTFLLAASPLMGFFIPTGISSPLEISRCSWFSTLRAPTAT